MNDWRGLLLAVLVGAFSFVSCGSEAPLPCNFDGYEAALTVLDPAGSVVSEADLDWPVGLFAGDGDRFYMTSGNSLSAHDTNGGMVWTLPWGVRRIEFDSAGRLLVVTRNDMLRAVGPADGSLLWSRQLSGLEPRTLVVGRTVAFITTGATVKAIDTESGGVLWRADDLLRQDGTRVQQAGDLVFGPTSNRGELRVVNARTGRERIVVTVAEGRGANRPVAAAGPVAVVEEITTALYEGGPERIVVKRALAVDSRTGRHLWRAPMHGGSPNGVELVGDVLVVGIPSEGITAYDLRDGTERWSLRNFADYTPAIAADQERFHVMASSRSFSPDFPQVLVQVDRASGRVIWEHEFDDEGRVHGPVVAGNVIVAAGQAWDSRQDEPDQGWVVAVDMWSGEEAWRHPLRDAVEQAPLNVGGNVVVVSADPPVLCGH